MCSILLLNSKSNTISKILYTTLTVLQLTQIFTPTHLARSSPASNFELNSPETVHTTHYHFDKQIVPYMQLHKLDPSDSNNVTCNDKSPAGYYKRLNNHSKSWIIYLQGGGYCGSEEACLQRWQTSPYLMSSSYWPKLKTGEYTFPPLSQIVEFQSKTGPAHPYLCEIECEVSASPLDVN